MHAIGINPMDIKIRNGWLREQMPLRFPAVLGSDMAGVVDQIGEGVTGLATGDRVVGLAQSGAYAEQTLARADVVAVIPGGLSFAQAVTIPTAAETAQRVIRLLDPEKGETVLVNGAAGSVGSAAVQLLVRGGVHVIGTAGPQYSCSSSSSPGRRPTSTPTVCPTTSRSWSSPSRPTPRCSTPRGPPPGVGRVRDERGAAVLFEADSPEHMRQLWAEFPLIKAD